MRPARVVVLFLVLALASLTASSAMARIYAKAPKGKPSADDIEVAKKAMATGATYTDENNPDGQQYFEAYPHFRKAYELSGSANALRALAICALNLELDGEAIKYFERYLASGHASIPDNKGQVEQDLTKLKGSVAWITMSSDRPIVLVTDERTPHKGSPIRNKYKVGLGQVTIGIHKGSHKFVAKSEGRDDITWTVELQAGQKLNHEFVFDKNAPVTDPTIKPLSKPSESEGDTADGSSRPVPAYVWATLGATVAVGIGGGVVAGLAAADKSTYDTELNCDSAACLAKTPAERQDAFDGIKTKNLVADILFGVAGAGAVTTLVLFLTRPEVKADGDKKEARFGKDWMVAPVISPQFSGAALVANF